MSTFYVYIGLKGGEVFVYDVKKSDQRRRLPLRLDLVNHSPTGFAWGYEGSGPAQLALALLVWEYGESFALDCYQQFKRDVIAGQGTEWILTSTDLRSWSANVIQRSASESSMPDQALYNCCAGCLPPDWQAFSRLEVMPVRESDGCCEVLYDEGDGKPDFWSVYGRRRKDGAVEVITDAPDETVARLIAGRFARFTGLEAAAPSLIA